MKPGVVHNLVWGWRSKTSKASEIGQQLRQMLLLVPRVVAVYKEAGVSYLILSAILSVYDGIAPVISIWLTKLMIDSVSEQLGARAWSGAMDFLGHIDGLIALQVAIWLLASVADILVRPLIAILGERGSHLTRQRVSEKTSSVPYIYYEDTQFYNKIEAARKAQGWPEYTSVLFFQMATSATRLISVIALMAFIGWWVAPLIVLAMLPYAIAKGRYISQSHHLFHYQSSDRRQLNYLTSALTERNFAKEMRQFDLSEFFLGKYRELWRDCYQARRSLFLSRHRIAVVADLPGIIAAAGVYFYLMYGAASGVISIGELAMGIGATLQLRQATGIVAHNVIQVFRSSLHVMDYFALMDLESEERAPEGATTNLVNQPAPEDKSILRIENVSFRYPGSDVDALHRVDLEVGPGEVVALVGHNGAGKSTLVKIISGLLEPSEGCVWFGGERIQSDRLAYLRQRVSVIYQDFQTYDLTLRENIALSGRNGMVSEDELMVACQESGLDAIVQRLPEGLDTMLGRTFGGTDLSVGEWQHVALARCLYKKQAEMMVLDEPAASLDAESEYHLYRRLADAAGRKTTFLVSHRLSTVRAASRIVVIDKGRVVEDGTHADLLAAAGTYARFYSMQAERFQD